MNGGFSGDILFESLNNNGVTNFIGVVKCKCQSCGGTFIVRERLGKCLFCGSESILDDTYKGEVDSCYMLPFSKNRDEALDDFKKTVLKNPLIPLVFRKKDLLNSMKKVYFLTDLNDLNIKGMIKFIAMDENGDKKGKNSNIKNNRFEVLNTVNFDYSNVMGNNNSKISLDMFNEISDYDFSGLIAFGSDNLDDCAVIVGDLDEEVVLNKAGNEVMRSSLKMIKDNINHDKKKVSQHNLVVSSISKKIALVPAYILSLKNNNQNYIYIMNGQTGKSYNNIGFGKRELGIFSVVVFAIIFLLAFLIAYFV